MTSEWWCLSIARLVAKMHTTNSPGRTISWVRRELLSVVWVEGYNVTNNVSCIPHLYPSNETRRWPDTSTSSTEEEMTYSRFSTNRERVTDVFLEVLATVRTLLPIDSHIGKIRKRLVVQGVVLEEQLPHNLVFTAFLWVTYIHTIFSAALQVSLIKLVVVSTFPSPIW